MARRFFTPVQDASIYEQFPARNAGFDEILEVGKSSNGTYTIRSLLQFDLSTISSSVVAGDIPANAEYILNLRISHASNFQRNQTIEVFRVSQSWDEGSGFFEQDLKNPQDGVSWTHRISTGNTQVSGGLSASVDVWGSAFDPLQGGTILSGSGISSASLTFNWQPNDVRLDIGNFVRDWLSGSFENHGLLIRLPMTEESNSFVRSNLRFYSRNTHTIHPPTLEVLWNSQTFAVTPNCGLVSAPEEVEVFVPQLRPILNTGSVNRIRFGARAVQPIKSFTDTFRFGNKYFFGSSSWIGIVDEATNDVIYPFDSGSLLSADATGSYFDLRIENMFINRNYKILMQIEKPWGLEIIDLGHSFRIK